MKFVRKYSKISNMKKALLVGISTYNDTAVKELLEVPSDIIGLSAALLSAEIGAFDQVDCIGEKIGPSTTRNQIQVTVEDFFQKGKEDELAFMYIGSHAEVHHGGLHILPSDYDSHHPFTTSIPISFIASCIRGSRFGSVVLILDCCYANAASWEFFSSKRMPFEINEKDEHVNICVIASTRKDAPAIDGGFVPFFTEVLDSIDPITSEAAVHVNRIFNAVRERMEEPALPGAGEVGIRVSPHPHRPKIPGI